MDFQTLARERYSVRSFRDEPVTREITDKILDAALAAPTACNRQPFRITVVLLPMGYAAEDARPSPMHSSFRPRADVVTEA